MNISGRWPFFFCNKHFSDNPLITKFQHINCDVITHDVTNCWFLNTFQVLSISMYVVWRSSLLSSSNDSCYAACMPFHDVLMFYSSQSMSMFSLCCTLLCIYFLNITNMLCIVDGWLSFHPVTSRICDLVQLCFLFWRDLKTVLRDNSCNTLSATVASLLFTRQENNLTTELLKCLFIYRRH